MRLGKFVLCAAAAVAAAGALAQEAAPAIVAACPKAQDVTQRHLLGLWRAEVEGAPGATLLLEKHPEFAETFRGKVNRDGQRAELAGDVDEGEFTLEESANGINISATWSGDVVEGSCGKEIRGTWQGSPDSPPRAFVLRRLPASH